jgi:hypothetical protein
MKMKKRFVGENFTLFHSRLSIPDLQEGRVGIIQSYYNEEQHKRRAITSVKRSSNGGTCT